MSKDKSADKRPKTISKNSEGKVEDMKKPLRVLIVEDSEEDTLLVLRELKRGGYDPVHERVETAEAMKSALSTKTWDLVLADYSLPQFSGLKALQVFKESELDLPFIVVSGTIGEDVAVEAMKAGARDYLMKGKLKRLVPAIEQELHQTGIRRKLKAMEEEFLRSEKFLMKIIEKNADGMVLVNVDGIVRMVNPAAEVLLDRKADELVGENFGFPAIGDEVSEIEIIHKDGNRAVAEMRVVETEWEGETVFLASLHDITERKRSEEMLRASEERYRTLFEGATEGILVADIAGTQFKYANPAICRMLAYTVEELTQLGVSDIHPKKALERVTRDFEAQARGERTLVIGLPCRRKDGSIIYANIATAQVAIDGCQHSVGFFTDITEWKQSEQALRETEDRYRDLVESNPEPICTHDLQGNFLSLNPAAIKLIGYGQSALLKMNVRDILAPEVRDQFPSYSETIRREGAAKGLMLIETATGEKRILEYDNTLRREGVASPVVRAINRDVTEQKRAEQALRESEERYRVLVETSPDAISLFDLNLKLIMVNELNLRLFGYGTHAEVIGKSVLEFLAPEQLTRAREDIEKVLKTGSTGPVEYTLLKKDGTLFPAELKASLILDKQKKPSAILCVIRDITERKAAEEALRKSEEKYRTILENIEEGYYEVDLAGNFTFVNDSMCRIFGYSREELVGINNRQYMDRENAKRVFQVFNRVFKTGEPHFVYDYEIIRKDQAKRHVETSASLLKDSSGPIGYRGILRDITERKNAEEALRESEKRYRLLAENVTDIIWTANMNLRLTYISPSVTHLRGYSVEEALALERLGLTPSSYGVAAKAFQEEHLIEETKSKDLYRSRALELEVTCKDGSTKWTESTITFIRDPNDSPVGILGVTRDITDRKQAEEALKKSEQRYRTLVESSTDAILMLDLEGNISAFNQAFLDMFGYQKSEVEGKSIRIIHPSDESFHSFGNEVYPAIRRLGFCRCEWELNHKGGAILPVETVTSAIKTFEGSTLGYIAMIRDISERKRTEEEKTALQEQLRQSQKMEAIGRLAGGVAHDFNNLLTVIRGYSQITLDEIKKDDHLKEPVEEVRKAADRAADLTRQLLAFSRRQVMEVEVLDLNATLRNLDKMLHRVIGEDIELVTSLERELGKVMADPGQIEQVIMNLAVNARDAMPNGGKLTIETANADLDQSYARAHVAVTPGRYVMISVSDTGVGMTPEVRDRVFEPFFTTKTKGKGTGLGLSTVYGIVKQSGGNIWVYSEPGKGTAFKIYLPQVDELSDEVKERRVSKELSHGSETILIAEDEEVVLKLAGRILRKQGYDVWEALGGDEAVRICEQQKKPFQLLLTDVVMPQMSGRQLADRLNEIYEDFKVLYMSGYTDNAIIHHGVLDKGVDYLQKPFTAEGLLRKVREMLDK